MSESETRFMEKWADKVITLTNPNSSWTLEEHNSQRDAESFHGYHKPSGAWASFLCRNTDDTDDVAVVRIIMQIPYAGSEYACYEERARQASEILDTDSRERVEADEILTRNQCTACPAIRHHEITKQENDDTELVPGEFLHYLLFDKAPGVQLDWDLFWSWDREERDAVRSAFREAWLECVRAGVNPNMNVLRHLFWSRETGKIVIAGLKMPHPVTGPVEWEDYTFMMFDLVDTSRANRSDENGMDEWIY
ncbi:hypothetical protein BJX62DRAFT_232689 [Aspergillus germanicus]